MTNIYILGLSYTNSTPSDLNSVTRALSETLSSVKGSSQLEVRAGYFGMCVRQRGIIWLCSSDASGLAEQIGPENDPLNLIGTASKFKGDVIFSGLLFMAVVLASFCTTLLATFPSWDTDNLRTGSDVDIKPFPSRPVSQVALAQAFVAAVLLLIASLWQHVGAVGSAAMAETANYGNVESSIGTVAMVMAWAGFTIEMCVTIGLLVMILSIIVLDRLTDD
ncbi:Nn.00g081850.m01.CDS01 [Neocucurbitaria sp. VM-36]